MHRTATAEGFKLLSAHELALLEVSCDWAFITDSSLVSYRSVEMAKEDAFMLANEMSAKYSYEIKAELQAARVTSESLMTVFKTLIERDEADWDTLNAVLQNSLRQKEYNSKEGWNI